MRLTPCYYVKLRGLQWPLFYDQFECFNREKRVKKGERLKIEIDKPNYLPEIAWKKETMPQQVTQTAPNHLYFRGDLIHKALLSHSVPALATSMQTLRLIEIFYAKEKPLINRPGLFFSRCVLEPLAMADPFFA